jgi:hypothetical protein
MPATYEPIATQTLVSGTNSIIFSSIPSTYTDLRLVFTGVSQPTNTRFPALRFNSDSGGNYSFIRLVGDGVSGSSSRGTSLSQIPIISDGMGDTIPVFFTIDVFSYAGSTFKTSLITSSEDTNGSGMTISRVGLYTSTSAITTINLIGASGTGIFGVGCIATLYGIKNA